MVVRKPALLVQILMIRVPPPQMYSEWQRALTEAGEDDSVVVAMITGAGDYYCSGNDLSNFMNIPPEGPEKMAAEAKGILRCI